MPVNEEALAEHADDPAYIAMGNLLFGTDDAEVPLTVRDPNGRRPRRHGRRPASSISTPARKALGISPKLLSFIDLLHVISYPFLLWAAWLLHRRNSRDAVSSILSLAVLLTIAAEQPSSIFLANVGVPRWLNVAHLRSRQRPAAGRASCCSRTAICRGGWSACSPRCRS